MKFINWRLVITAIFLSVVACKKHKTDIGLGLQEDQLESHVDESTTILAQTIKIDSVRTDTMLSNLLGNYSDPLIGNIKTSIFSQVDLMNVSPNEALFANTVIESTELILDYNGYSYGTGNQVSYNVFEISEDFDSTEYSNSSLTYLESLIENSSTTYYADSIISQGKLSIPLNSLFGEKMQLASGDNLGTTTSFTEYFKGIYIQSNEVDGRVLNFDLPNSMIKMVYHLMDDTTQLTFNFPLSTQIKNFTHIDHDYTLTFDQDTLVSNDNFLFLQGGGSLITSISLTDLLENHHPGEIYNKVELVIPVDTLELETYPRINIAYPKIKTTEGFNIKISKNNVFLNNSYRFDITKYIQQVVDGTLENTNILIYTDIITTSRVAILKDQIKLRIIHTE